MYHSVQSSALLLTACTTCSTSEHCGINGSPEFQDMIKRLKKALKEFPLMGNCVSEYSGWVGIFFFLPFQLLVYFGKMLLSLGLVYVLACVWFGKWVCSVPHQSILKNYPWDVIIPGLWQWQNCKATRNYLLKKTFLLGNAGMYMIYSNYKSLISHHLESLVTALIFCMLYSEIIVG